MQKPYVVAVVTNYNGLDDTIVCVESALDSDYPNLSIVIVDNGSTDDSADILAARFPDVPQLRMTPGGAVTAAYNAGVEHGLAKDATYILMLNNDVKLSADMVTLLVEAAERDPQIGVVTPKIYYFDRPDVIWFAGARANAWDFGAYDDKRGDRDAPDNSVAGEVDYAWACGMLFRSEMLKEIGLFDTRFWLYYDDVDICLRTKGAGYRLWYCPEAVLWHKVSGSTGSKRFARIWARSKMLLFRKHAHGLHRFALVFYAFGHAFYRYLRPTPTSQKIHDHFGAFLLGLWEGLWLDTPAE